MEPEPFTYALPAGCYATRVTASRIRDDIVKAAAGRPVTLDFGGVQAMTISFADELIGNLAEDAVLSLTGLDDAGQETAETVFRRRGLPFQRVRDGSMESRRA